MNDLKFNDGYKEYRINGDENKVIRISVFDMAIMKRITVAQEQIKAIADKMTMAQISNDATEDEKIKAAAESMDEADKAIREQIDYIIGAPVSDIAFGNQCCLSLTDNGNPIYANFLNALVPIIKNDVEAAAKKSQKNISKYTKATK